MQSVKRSFDDVAGSSSTDVGHENMITPPHSTTRKISKEKKLLTDTPLLLSPGFSSPIKAAPKAKKAKSENGSRSGGNLTIQELLKSLELRKTRGELTKKPPYSYATLISLAILQSQEGKLTLSQIYSWISLHFPYYKQKDSGWQNSIRHNLSLNEAFIKTDKSNDGKGHFWQVKPGCETKFFKGETCDIHELKQKLQKIESFLDESQLSIAIEDTSTVPKLDVPIVFSNNTRIDDAEEIVDDQLDDQFRFGDLGFTTKKATPVRKLIEEQNLPRDNSNHTSFDPPGPISVSHYLKPRPDIKKYTSSFNSSFEETSPFSQHYDSGSLFEPSKPQPVGSHMASSDLLKTPILKDYSSMEKSPIRFITTPRDGENSILMKWQTPTNIFEDFYCSPIFKGMTTPIKTSKTPVGTAGKLFSPSRVLPPPANKSRLPSNGLFGVDVYSVLKRATQKPPQRPTTSEGGGEH